MQFEEGSNFFSANNDENKLNFIENIKKKKLKQELGFFKNPNLIKKNINLINFLKDCLTNYNFYITKIKLFGFNRNNLFFEKNYKILNILQYYNNFNYNKLKNIKDNKFFSNSNKIIIIFDLRPVKIKIYIINNNRCVFGITPGIIYKKLGIKQKKTKKTEKMVNLMLKIVSLKIKKMIAKNKFIINIKGTRSNIFNVITLINRNFKSNLSSLIYSPHISYGRYKFKKIKSIKRRLRKRFSKLLRN